MTTFNLESGVVLDTSKLPQTSIDALIARGVGHVFGNETASRLVGSIRKQINGEKPSEVSTDQIKAWRAANADAVAEMTRKAHEDFVTSLASGTLGVRASSGPKVDPVTKHMRQSASAEIVAILKAKGALASTEKKTPEPEAVFTLGTVEITFSDLIARRLANPKEGPRLRKDAEAHVAALARQKAKADANAKAASEAEGNDLEAMGF